MHRTLVVSFFFFVAIKLFAQDTQNSVLNNEVSIQFDDVSLPTALRQLNREANLSFSYNSKKKGGLKKKTSL